MREPGPRRTEAGQARVPGEPDVAAEPVAPESVTPEPVTPEPVTPEQEVRTADRPLRGLLVPRLRRVDLAVAALLGVLGFAAVVQVRSTQEDGPLATARQEDLVQILDELANRNDRLRTEVATLERTRRDLTTGSGTTEAALVEARRRTQLLGVLAGTVAARGPGLRLTITDPEGTITADVLLGVLEELRAAGVEALQLSGPVDADSGGAQVRVVASTSLLDATDGGVLVDGVALRAPYRFTVVGDPATVETALGIPGGVVDAVETRGGRAIVVRDGEVLVGALRPLTTPRYARPAP